MVPEIDIFANRFEKIGKTMRLLTKFNWNVMLLYGKQTNFCCRTKWKYKTTNNILFSFILDSIALGNVYENKLNSVFWIITKENTLKRFENLYTYKWIIKSNSKGWSSHLQLKFKLEKKNNKKTIFVLG